MRIRLAWAISCITSVLSSMACRDLSGPQPAPALSGIVVTVNPENGLSATVQFLADHLDSARATWDDGEGDRGVTRCGAVPGKTVHRLVVAGLRASHSYSVVVEGWGAGQIVRSAPASLTTGELPAAIRSLRLRSDGAASTGLTLVAPLLPDVSATATGYLVAFDSTGQIRWYRGLPGLFPIEAKQQRNGHITVYAGRSFGWQEVQGEFLELTASGAVVRSYSIESPDYTDPHELLLTFDDTAVVAVHMLGYLIRHYDLSSLGGSPTAPLAVHVLERRAVDGGLRFRWSAADLFTPSDWPNPTAQAVDLDHPSSLAIDGAGNYVVSFQAMNEVTAIDATSGHVLWRLGGKHNEFTFRSDSYLGFAGQHDVQVLPNGHLLLLDDELRSQPGPARAVEYALDVSGRVATLVWEYRPLPAVVSPIMGSVQRLASGATLIGFGAAGRVTEVAPNGTVTWTATLASDEGTPVSFYRAVRLRSLYGYETP